jgi:hypothetical protein
MARRSLIRTHHQRGHPWNSNLSHCIIQQLSDVNVCHRRIRSESNHLESITFFDMLALVMTLLINCFFSVLLCHLPEIWL